MIRKRKYVLRYSVFRPLASLLPEKALRWLDHKWPLYRDDADGWTFWTDASYYKYCRIEQRQGKVEKSCALAAGCPYGDNCVHQTMCAERRAQILRCDA